MSNAKIGDITPWLCSSVGVSPFVWGTQLSGSRWINSNPSAGTWFKVQKLKKKNQAPDAIEVDKTWHDHRRCFLFSRWTVYLGRSQSATGYSCATPMKPMQKQVQKIFRRHHNRSRVTHKATQQNLKTSDVQETFLADFCPVRAYGQWIGQECCRAGWVFWDG